MKKIIVTGGAGYIGAHVINTLLNSDDIKIDVIDNFCETRKNIITNANVAYHEVDLRDKDSVMKIFESCRPDLVFHFAAVANVPDSVVNPFEYYDNNIIGGINLLECMRSVGTNNIIFSSAGAVYGEPVTETIEENHPKNPTNPYGYTKLVFENILKDYHKAYNLNSISLRYFCPAGCDNEAGLGEYRVNESHVIPSIVKTLLGQRSEFYVCGNDFPTPDGSGIRDYIHISDVSSAHEQAMKKIINEKDICTQYNIGINKGFSVLELIKAAEEISGKKLTYSIKPRRNGDPSCLIANSEKAQRELDWKPKVTDVREIIKDSYIFFNTKGQYSEQKTKNISS